MKKIIIVLSLIAFCLSNSFAQNKKASISIFGQTQKRIDKYSKDFIIKKRYATSPLSDVNIDVMNDKGVVVLSSKSDDIGNYSIIFELDPNKNYIVSFSKGGFFKSQFLFNTNGISLNKKINFHDWDFYLYKRIIGLKDSVFVEPTVFYYDSERGYMTYDEEFNIPLAIEQEKKYLEYMSNLNETDYKINDIELTSENKNEEDNANEVIDTSSSKKPVQEVLDMTSLVESMAVLNDNQTGEELEKHEVELSNQWQKVTIAKVKAVTDEDKARISEAEKLLLEKENQIFHVKQQIATAHKQIELQKAENKNKTNLLTMAGFAFILVLLLLIVLYKNSKERIRVNKLLTQKNNEVYDSIKYAQRLQNAILPPESVINKNLQESFIIYKPKDIVSGDFYWVENIEDKVLFAVVDCTGHGVPGAFISIVAFNALNQAVNQYKLTKPSDILDQVNINISKTLHQLENTDLEDGLDISLCLLDKKTNELHFSGAYQPLYILRNEVLEVIKADNFSIGSLKGKSKKYKNNIIQLEKEDLLYLFSDGFVDQFGGEKGKKFMRKRLKQLLLNNNKKPLEEQSKSINSEFSKWKGPLEQVDDVCLMGIRI